MALYVLCVLSMQHTHTIISYCCHVTIVLHCFIILSNYCELLLAHVHVCMCHACSCLMPRHVSLYMCSWCVYMLRRRKLISFKIIFIILPLQTYHFIIRESFYNKMAMTIPLKLEHIDLSHSFLVWIIFKFWWRNDLIKYLSNFHL